MQFQQIERGRYILIAIPNSVPFVKQLVILNPEDIVKRQKKNGDGKQPISNVANYNQNKERNSKEIAKIVRSFTFFSLKFGSKF